mmetsp:Transcript_3435/g.3251  ORF Transcript_3435/g.3251 Transcript_3435/m.3251 type:complete len:502 (-) Transcript_3435:194-1699(-)
MTMQKDVSVPRDTWFRKSLKDNKSEWDHSLATIESILSPSSDAFAALSESQRTGLNRMKQMLIKPPHQRESSHIPIELLTMSKDNDDDVCDYIVSHFGGVVTRKRSLKSFVKATMVASSFIKVLTAKHQKRQSFMNNCLREFLELDEEKQQRVSEILSWENLTKWGFNIFELDELTGGKPLLFVGWALLDSPHSQNLMASMCGNEQQSSNEGYHFKKIFNLSTTKLCAFIRSVEADYNRENPYHNNVHAADVVQTLHSLLQMDGAKFASSIKIFATFLAAICHDIHHPGVSNTYQVNSRSDLAIVYNDTSVLENMHAAKTFDKLMGKNCQPELNLFDGVLRRQVDCIRKMTVCAILHTDMTKHFTAVNSMKAMAKRHENDKTLTLDENEENIFLSFLLHVADISNAGKPGSLSVNWADRCLEEFFAQGDKEKELNLPVSPLCDRETTSRPQSQIGFIKFVIHPTYVVLGEMLPLVKANIVPIIQKNLSYWEQVLMQSDDDN